MSSASTPLTFKIYFLLPSGKQEIRRFTPVNAESQPLLGQVLSYLTSTYATFYPPPLRFLLQYEDGEGDMVAVSSEVELKEAIRLTAEKNLMKLWCQLDQQTGTASGLQTPMSGVSGLSTPHLTANQFPPSPSAAGVEQSQSAVSNEVSVVSEKAPLLLGGRSDDEDVVQVTSADNGHSSEDEYERIEVDAPAKTPSPKVDSPKASAPSSSPKVAEVCVMTAPAVSTQTETAVVPQESASTQTAAPVVESKSVVTQTTTTATATATTQANQPEVKPAVTQTVNDDKPIIHQGFVCDECHVSPIVGERYHCLDCKHAGGFDLCVVCHATGSNKHPQFHRMRKFDTSTNAYSRTHTKQTPSGLSSSSSSSAATSSRPVHAGIICDGCGTSPIVGDRYHCTACTNPGGFDLCSACEAQGAAKHPLDHVLLKMKTPAHVPVGAVRAAFPQVTNATHCARSYNQNRRCQFFQQQQQQQERPKCAFISDVTLADGLKVKRGEVLKKVWSIKNTGSSAWPSGTRLVFCGGDLLPESDGCLPSGIGALVPFADAGAIVHVEIDIVVPDETGRFRATFRLETPDGNRFGPRIWLDLTVPESEDDSSESESGSDDEEEDSDSSSSSDSDSSSDEEDEPIDEEIIVESIKAATAPQPAAAATPVAVPVAAPVASAPEAPAQPAPSAPVAVAESKQSEEEVALAKEFTEAVKVESVVQEPAAASSSSSSGAVQPVFQYPTQLAALRSMGFKDQALCSYLLLNNRGDVQKVVAWLLNNAQ